MTTDAPLLLATWLSPAFPVGGFAYSHGLEDAWEHGAVTDAADLEAWISDLLDHGGGRNDAILLAAAWRAARAGDEPGLREITTLAAALASGAERHLETTAQGRAFLDAVQGGWPDVPLAAIPDEKIAYPIALGIAAAAAHQPLAATLAFYLHGFVGLLVSAALRLGIVGQSAAQRVTAALIGRCLALAASATESDLDALGGACFAADLGSLRHETQYSRLFRS